MQTPPASVDEAGKTLERCLVEIEHLRATCHSIGEIRLLEGRLKAADDLLAVYKTEVQRLTGSALADTAAGAARVANYEERIKAYEARLLNNEGEVKKLRRETFRLRRSRNIAIGIIIGLGVGLAWALSR